MFDQIRRKVYEPICLLPKMASVTISTGDGLESFSDLLVCIIRGVQTVAAQYGKVVVHSAAIILSGRLQVVAELISGLSIINRLVEWFCPEEGKSRPFWLNPPVDFSEIKRTRSLKSINPAKLVAWAAKVVGRMFHTAVNIIDLIKLFDSFGLLALGRVASAAIGCVPILGLVKDSLQVIASGFSVISHTATIICVAPKWNAARKKRSLWGAVAKALDEKALGKLEAEAADKIENRVATRLATKCFHKRDAYAAKRNALMRRLTKRAEGDEAFAAALAEDIANPSSAAADSAQAVFKDDAKGQALFTKYQAVLQMERKWGSRINEQGELVGTVNEYAAAKLARELQRTQIIVDALPAVETKNSKQAAAARSKLEALQGLEGVDNGAYRFVNHRYQVYKAAQKKASNKIIKSTLSIAFEVTRVALIVLGVVALALGLVTFGWSLAIFALAFALSGIGFGKFLLEELVLNKDIPVPDIRLA